jgi:predicted nucleotidyltransferase
MNIESIVCTFFDGKPNVYSVDLFGSYAQQRATEKSDVDIAFLCDYAQLPTFFDLIDWREELETLLHKKVDLVCLNEASPILGMQVAKNRKNILLKNPRQYANYQMKLFSSYAELKELRAPMEANILKRKYFS